jgi:hypothetical protein
VRTRTRLAVAAVAVAALTVTAAVALADDVGPITFEPPTYVVGDIHGQDGWSSSGPYDHAVAAQSLYSSFGTQSLRISNAITSGSFGDHTFSKENANEAGEASAEGDGTSGPREGNFDVKFDIASAVPTAEQPGLQVVASPDRGDGARMSWVQVRDTPTGLEVRFNDYQDNAPFGDAVGDDAGCGNEDAFVETVVASGLDRSVPHRIRIFMVFREGPRDDLVRVYVDNALVHTGTSWEDYFRYCEGNQTRTVDSVLFRTSGTPAPATLGKGFYIDRLTTFSR